MKRFFITVSQLQCCCVLALLTFGSALGQTGQLTVSVIDDSGVPVVGAHVSLSPRPLLDLIRGVPQLPAYNGRSTSSNLSGIAVFISVPRGAYVPCATDVVGKLIDSCAWVENPSTIYVDTGQPTTTKIVLHKGSLIVLQVNDPQNLFASISPASSAFKPYLVTTHGQYLPLIPGKLLVGSREFLILAPSQTVFRLKASSRYTVVRDNGAILDGSNPASFLEIRTGAALTSVSVALSLKAR